MMYAWSFAAETPEEVVRLLRALSKHRYVKEVELHLHWTVDAALGERPTFAPHARAFDERRRRETGLELGSRDPSLWRAATVEEVSEALLAFWAPDAEALHERLGAFLEQTGLEPAEHLPFEASPEEPPHPELILLDWVLLPIDELDADKHKGALDALAEAREEVPASAAVHQEGPTLSEPELIGGVLDGKLVDEFVVWSEVPYAYADYVFRGASKAAKLSAPPTGYREL